MDRIEKFLNKRNWKERALLMNTIALIINDELKNLDIKKLKGFSNLYRVRIQSFRIIFEMENDDNTIIDIYKRDDQTYKV